MGAVLARGWEVCAEASRRKYFSAGGARGADIGSGRRAIGLDLGGDNFGAAQTTDSHEPGRAVAFLRSTRRHLQKKVFERQNNSAPTWPGRFDAVSGSKASVTQPGWWLSTSRRSTPI